MPRAWQGDGLFRVRMGRKKHPPVGSCPFGFYASGTLLLTILVDGGIVNHLTPVRVCQCQVV